MIRIITAAAATLALFAIAETPSAAGDRAAKAGSAAGVTVSSKSGAPTQHMPRAGHIVGTPEAQIAAAPATETNRRPRASGSLAASPSDCPVGAAADCGAMDLALGQ